MRTVVAPYGWGAAHPIDIEVLLTDVASHLSRLLRCPIEGTIIVVPAPCNDPTPRTHYRFSSRDPIFIQLTPRDKKWAQFAYQFSHEFCHVLSDYERLRKNPNSWFHETICELASIFTIRRMAEQWPTHPPYPDWANYVDALINYGEEHIFPNERRLSENTTLSTLLSLEEEELRKDPYQREKNAMVAYSLLPIFESSPAGWNAIRRLPDSSAMFRDYLLEWHTQVEPADKPFVKRIIQLVDE